MKPTVDGYSQLVFPTTQGFEVSNEARAQADLKFTYVVSCQIYGQQKQKRAPEAADIALLLQRYNIYDIFIYQVNYFFFQFCIVLVLWCC